MTTLASRTIAPHVLVISALAGCGTEIVGYRAPAGGDAGSATVTDTPAVAQDRPASMVVDAGVTPPADVYVTPEWDAGPPSRCVSGTHWTQGLNGDRMMEPGQACVSCHVSMGATDREVPRLIGGTAYYQLAEMDDCYGFAGTGATTAGAAYVEATDSAGYTFRMGINGAGNFYYTGRTAIRFPLHHVATVGPSGLRNEMAGDPPHGDCNGCHTQMGTSTVSGDPPAPGRIQVIP